MFWHFIARAALAATLLLGLAQVHAKSLNTKASTGLVTNFELSRTTCVAPCYVHADAVHATNGTTSIRTSLPFHEIDHEWDWGDPSAGTWGAGAQAGVSSKNASHGPVAGHVYESDGTYTVTLRTKDGTASGTKTRTVTVTDPAVAFATTNTICVSNDTDFTDCPAGATQHASITSGATACGYFAVDKRVLFHAGHTWSFSSTCSFSYANGGTYGATIGKFGSGADPIFQRTAGFNSDVPILRFSSAATSAASTMKDVRVMDIDFDGSLATPPILGQAIGTNGGIDQLTLLRITGNSLRLLVSITDSLLNGGSYTGSHIWDQWALVDSNVTNPVAGTADPNTFVWGTYMAGERMFYAGNNIDLNGTADFGVSHNARFTYLGKSVISNNSLSEPGPVEHTIKLHSNNWSSGVPPTGVSGTGSICAGYTCKNVISDNKLAGNYGAIVVAIGPQDSSSDQRLQDHIVERNWFVAGPGVQQLLSYWGTQRGMLRNNLIDTTGALFRTGIFVGRRPVDTLNLSPDYVWVYQNSINSSDTNNDFIAVEIQTGVTNITVKNNLAYAPNDTSGLMLGGSGTATSASNNTANRGAGGNTTQTDPVFGGALTSVTGWTVSGYPKAAGATGLKVPRDFFGTLRSTITPTIGAAE